MGFDILYLIFSGYFFMHSIRDVMHHKRIDNFFTRFAHFYDNHRLELPSAVLCLLLSFLFLSLYFKWI